MSSRNPKTYIKSGTYKYQNMPNELVIAYSATFISVSGRFIFMYLLYTKKSTNPYSLLFSVMNIVSSSLWITYSEMTSDMPLLIRGSCDLLLFSISTAYIIHNILALNKVQQTTTVVS
jgi:lipid-A-disaccharide synthase-like uncharacterized protein